jgi:sugar porter (SP) family MFS transporter
MPGFKAQFFPEETQQQQQTHDAAAATAAPSSQSPYCKHNEELVSLFVSSLFLAGIVGALVASVTSRKFGRRNTMLAGGVAFLIGAVLMSCAVHMAMLIAGRLAMGLGVGLTTQASPLFLSEMAPYKYRGALNIMFQLAVAIGIFAAQLINYGTQHLDPWGWRLSLGLTGAPAIFLVLGCMFLPDTPNSLLERGFSSEAKTVLKRIRGVDDVEAEFEDIQDAAELAERNNTQWRALFCSRRYRPQLVLCLTIPILQQLSGINSVIFYAPQLFSSLGAGNDAALMMAVVIGSTGVLATLVALWLVDRAGRRALFFEGGAQMIAAEVVIGALLAVYFTGPAPVLPPPVAAAIIALVCIFVAGFAWSWGPLCWLVCTEIQPLETRSAGYSLSVVSNLAATFLIGQLFLPLLCALQYGIFFFFAGWVVAMTAFVAVCLPETKGVPLEVIERELFAEHRVWRAMVLGSGGGGGAENAGGQDHEGGLQCGDENKRSRL